MGTLYRIALVLVIVGAVNWGLIGFFQFDLVAAIFGGQDAGLARLVYALVGIAGLVCIPLLMKPLIEEESSAASHTRTNHKPNYSMEAGKEADFSDLSKQRKNNDQMKK